MRIRAIALWIGVAVIGSVAALAADSDGRAPSEEERPNLPKAKVSARDNLLARSPAPRIVTGPYVSVQINVDAAGQNIVGDAANEVSLAVNPLNPNNMVVGWRQFDSIASDFREAGYAYTFNKGATWRFPGVIEPGVFRSDPVLDFDPTGIVFYQSLAIDPTIRVDVFRSRDGGAHFGESTYGFGGDKNWLVIDKTGGPGHGYHYGIWQRLASCCGDNVLTRSVNGGHSYSGPTPVARWPKFGTLAIGPDSTLYAIGMETSAASQDPSTIVVAHTTNVPDPSFSPETAASVVDLAGLFGLSGPVPNPNPQGLLGQANVAVDLSPGTTLGNVYVTATVKPDDFEPSRISFSRSVDGGLTFSPPVRINDDVVDARHWHWMAAHAVAPNSRIDVIWYDSRESPRASNLNRLYYSYSWDAGLTWSPNLPVSPVFDSYIGWPIQKKMGDYSSIVSDATGADVAYTATFNGEQDVYYVRLFPDCNGNGVSDVTDISTHQSQDCNLSHIPDECESAPVCVGAGSVPDGGSVPGTALTIGKGAGEAMVLSWGASCSTADADYAVYEGSLGDFASHAPRACSTEGALSIELTPSAADAYYLIVPVHADREGSYGTGVGGIERPIGPSACAPRVVQTCGG